MRKKVKILLKSIMIVLILVCSPASICYAEVDLNALEGYLNSTLIKQQMDQCNNPKYANGSSTDETIDPITGSLILKETDLSFTGRDGLDLNIGRYYNSSQDESDKKTEVATESYTYNTIEAGYVVDIYYEDGVINTIGTYSTEEAAKEVEIYYLTSVKDVIYAYAHYQEKTTVHTGVAVKTNNYIDKYNYDKTRYNLGAGWAFTFPSVEIEKYGGATYRYYHDENGAVYTITSIENTGKTNLEGYQGSDVRFLKDNGTYTNEDNVTSKYKFIASNQTVTYFGGDGRILGIKDVLGNEIKFKHTSKKIYNKYYPLISQIEDSVGRIIVFSYEDDAIKLTVTAPGEDEQITIQYIREFRIAKYLAKSGTFYDTYEYPVLSKVINPNGEEKCYEDYYYYNRNQQTVENYEYYSKTITDKSSTIGRYLIGAVVYKGYKVRYNYEKTMRNFGKDGVTESYRIKDRYEQIQRLGTGENGIVRDWEGEYNKVNYTYSGDCTGYPDYQSEENIPDTYQYWIESEVDSGLKSKTVFNGSKQKVYSETKASNGERKITTYVKYDETYKCYPTIIKEETYTSLGKQASELFIGMSYTSWGGVSSETKELTSEQFNNRSIREKYTTTYCYEDTNFPYYITKRQYYQNDNRVITTSCEYDSLGRISKAINERGEVTTYEYYYNESGDYVVEADISLKGNKESSVISIFGKETGFAYSKEERYRYSGADGSKIESINKMTYNMLLGLVKTKTDDKNTTVSYKYDKMGNVLEVCNPRVTDEDGKIYSISEVTSYEKTYYKDYLDKEAYLYGTIVNEYTEYKEKETGDVLYCDVSETFYDGFGNLRIQRSYDGSQWKREQEYKYDVMLRPIASTDVNDYSTNIAYDEWGDIKETIDSRGNLYVNDYDLQANKNMTYLIASEDIQEYRKNPDSNQYKQDYVEVYQNQFGQGIERRVYLDWPSQNEILSEKYEYDYAGNVVAFIDPNKNLNEDGYTKTCKYDEFNQVTKIKNALNEITEIEYAADGVIEKVTVKENERSSDAITVYEKEYDNCLNQIAKTDSSDESSTFTYNTSGRLASFADRKGTLETSFYDELDRITTIYMKNEQSSKSLQYNYSYDSVYGCTEEKMIDDGKISSWCQYKYDQEGNIKEKKAATTNFECTLGINYSGNIVTRIGVKSSESDYFYTNYNISDGGLLSQLQVDGQSQVNRDSSVNVQFNYCADGNVEKVCYPSLNSNNLETRYTYNSLSRLASVTNIFNDTILSKFEYEYDGNGNIISVKDGSKTTYYTYDKINRLIEVESTNGKHRSYTYDLLGNRIEGEKFTETIQTAEYSYDLNNRLKTVSDGSQVTSMDYYPNGLRARKTTNSKTVAYVYDENNHLVAEAEDSADITANYIWGNDKVFVKKEGNAANYYYLYNGHGDVVQIVDNDGNIVNSYEYDEWGTVITSNETISNPFKYTCSVYDDEIGLYYLNSRFYDPIMGRFITEDTYEGEVGNSQSLNPYVYCMNNPLLFGDSSGNKPKRIKMQNNNLLDRTGYTSHNKLYKWFCDFSVSTKSKRVFEWANFKRDDDGIYHVDVRCWQRAFGYCDFYDIVFNFGTDMERKKYTFSYNDTEMVVWLWKGDYLNLGAGCELGLYYRDEDSKVKFYKCYTQSTIQMSLQLKYKEKTIAHWKPTEDQWWITAFNPVYKDVKASDLQARFILTFKDYEDTGLYSAMKCASRKNAGQWRGVIFNDKKRTITFKI